MKMPKGLKLKEKSMKQQLKKSCGRCEETKP